MLILEGLVNLHRTIQLQLLQDYWLGHRLVCCYIEWFTLETNRDHSVIFEIASKYWISDSFVDCDGHSISSKGFLPTVVDIMVIWVKFTHSSPFYFTDCWDVNVHSCHLLFDHFQFALIRRPNIPDSYAMPDLTSITSHIHSLVLFCFSSIPSFFLELFLCASPEAYWVPTNLGRSSFSVLYFCLFIVFMEFSRQEYWNGLPFSSPVDHILSELSTMTHPSWVALHGIAHSFIDLDRAVVHKIRLVSFLWLCFSVCLPSDGET